MKVAVTGSSGLIGTALVASLREDGHEVIRLVRRPPRADDEVRWDPRAADGGLVPPGSAEPRALERIDACVHLAGAGVASQRWTARYKAEIRNSRVLGSQRARPSAGFSDHNREPFNTRNLRNGAHSRSLKR